LFDSTGSSLNGSSETAVFGLNLQGNLDVIIFLLILMLYEEDKGWIRILLLGREDGIKEKGQGESPKDTIFHLNSINIISQV
jgi:hypothetical protein